VVCRTYHEEDVEEATSEKVTVRPTAEKEFTMIVLGIDPGERDSGIVVFDTDKRRVLYSMSQHDNRSLKANIENAT